jgi:hypothetical protein
MTTITPAATKILPEVVGKAFYLELKPILDSEGRTRIWQGGDSIKQIFITPNGLDSTGRTVSSQIYARIISSYSPRSQWDRNTVEPLQNQAEILAHLEGTTGRYVPTPKIEDFDLLPDEIKRDLYANGMAQMLKREVLHTDSKWNEEAQNYDKFATQSWAITKKFSVEVTDEDLTAIHNWKTPQAIIRRINKVRDSA